MPIQDSIQYRLMYKDLCDSLHVQPKPDWKVVWA